jgi:hypothetical protein
MNISALHQPFVLELIFASDHVSPIHLTNVTSFRLRSSDVRHLTLELQVRVLTGIRYG